jgi:transposase InsO family protein
MPWQEICPVDQRVRFIREHQRGELTMTELCQGFGVSRRTGYKWLGRFEEQGREGLRDRSRAPHSHPNETDLITQGVVVELRRAHPTWGPKKIRAWLGKKWPRHDWPRVSTMGDILRRHGATSTQPRPQRVPPRTEPLRHATEPNAVWSLDFKGWFNVRDRSRCTPLTMSDAYSRYLLCAIAMDKTDYENVKPVLERSFREYGMPAAIRTDNGSPFATTGCFGLSRLAVWWTRLGIVHERIDAGHPEQNGRHERFHRTLKAETASPPAAAMLSQQRAFDRFQREYNHERPHEALDMQTPGSVYRYSDRPFPRTLPDFSYPDHFELRRVRHNGDIRWGGEVLYLTQALAGETVGLEPLDGRHWRVRFGPMQLGFIDGLRKRWTEEHRSSTGKVLPMCPV